MLAIFIAFVAVVVCIGALAFTFYPSYTIITQVLIIIVMGLCGVTMMFLFMLKPVQPYLDAKLKNGMIFFITQVNGNIVMKVPDKKTVSFDIEPFGTFFGNPHARKSFGGVPCFQVFEENSVPPEDDLVKFCSRLEKGGIRSLEEFKQNLVEGTNGVSFEDLDLKSITRYFNYVNPHYVNVRIERIAAELSKEYRQAWKSILPWISIMLVGLIFAAISYVIITSVAVPAPTTLPSVPGSNIIPVT